MNFWYRYEDVQHAPMPDMNGNYYGVGELRVYLREYKVLRTTPKGVILDVFGTPRFVRQEARKHFACPTVEEARVSFIARKNRQVTIHRAAMHRAINAIKLVRVEHQPQRVCG